MKAPISLSLSRRECLASRAFGIFPRLASGFDDGQKLFTLAAIEAQMGVSEN